MPQEDLDRRVLLESPLSFERKHFGPNQVRTIGGIKPGNKYRIMHGNKRHALILVLSEPYDRKGKLVFDYVILPIHKKSGLTTMSKHYCTDVSVVQYDDGNWNSRNWLSRTGRSTMELIEIKDLIDHLASYD